MEATLPSPRVGTAGWAVPRDVASEFPAEGSGLQRYAARFDIAEINSSFYRPHRRATYERWAASVPSHFRFSVKLPKAISHEARLIDCEALIERFAEEVSALGDRLGPVLVQLPPKLAFERDVAERIFAQLATILGGVTVCEPRHPSWFEEEADALLVRHRVARVAADPAPVPAAAEPGGWQGFFYARLHGSPRPYWSRYEPAAVQGFADAAQAAAERGVESWTIFDNTASGAAAANALEFQASATC